MIEKSEIIALINSEIEKNSEYEKSVMENYRKNPSDDGLIADANFMNGFTSALVAIRDKIIFME